MLLTKILKNHNETFGNEHDFLFEKEFIFCLINGVVVFADIFNDVQ